MRSLTGRLCAFTGLAHPTPTINWIGLTERYGECVLLPIIYERLSEVLNIYGVFGLEIMAITVNIRFQVTLSAMVLISEVSPNKSRLSWQETNL